MPERGEMRGGPTGRGETQRCVHCPAARAALLREGITGLQRWRFFPGLVAKFNKVLKNVPVDVSRSGK